jgi:hypothetical protein
MDLFDLGAFMLIFQVGWLATAQTDGRNGEYLTQ